MKSKNFFGRASIVALLGILLSTHSFAWEGQNLDMGSYFSIDQFDSSDKKEGKVLYTDYLTGEQRSGYLKINSERIGTLKDDKTGKEIPVAME